MEETEILSLNGEAKGKVALPKAFEEEVRPELILRAVLAENTRKLQPQGHYLLAGMQTTATYFGAMNSYRSGRHMGLAIRPREKLGGGALGKVRVVPSAKSGKRAHPHLIEKRLIEQINKKEYQRALASAVSATGKPSKHTKLKMPIVITNDIESIKKTKEIVKVINAIKLSDQLEEGKKSKLRKGLRRTSSRRRYKKSFLLVLGKESSAIKAARNIAGVDACEVSKLTANLLAPGGVSGRITVWSENAIKNLEESIKNKSL